MTTRMDERVSRLESAYERVATKEDLADVRGDLAGMESRMATKEDLADVRGDLADLESRMATKEDLADVRGDLAGMESRMATKEDLVDVRGDLAGMESRMATKEDLADLESRMATKTELNQLRTDVAPLKAAHARNVAVEQADFIAEDMGFELVRILNRRDIKRLVSGQNTSDISRADLRSFRLADLIMEVADGRDRLSYVAVEISFTADMRDTTRAIRNAEFLSRFTGRQARAAIAGVRRDNEIAGVESSRVFWYELEKSSLEVE